MPEWMLWGRFGGSVKLGSTPPPRLYLIPLTTSIENEGPLAYELGHRNRNDRNLEGCTRALDRAVSAESDGVVFPSSFLNLSFRDDVIARCQHRKLRIVHQITTTAFFAAEKNLLLGELIKRLDAGDAANIVFGADSVPEAGLLDKFEKWPEQVYFTYSARAKDETIPMLMALPKLVRERLYFHFPFHTKHFDNNLSCAQVNNLIIEINRSMPNIHVRPMLGIENFDPRVDPSLELEPMISPTLELRSGDGVDYKNRVPIEVSVIIPSYNNRDYLVNTIKHLARQDFPRSAFEIVAIDDGSTDQTESAIRELAVSLGGKINFKYIFSPRPSPRVMGDANYRAGISRNLGVKNSRGRILCFLDSDILTPPNFISDLVEKHISFDVVQCKRLNLVETKSDVSTRFEDVDANKDTFATEDGYWEKFHSLKNWGRTPFFWKYTCTYGLSISAQLFKRVGWIRRGFVFYGFEDVELGYRLAKVGARFHLNDMVTYHLFHKSDRSEFRNSDYLRQSLLAKTAQIFYLGLLEPELFKHFRGLMKEQIPISSLFLPLKVKPPPVLQIPVLAVRNWRWFAWRQRNRINSFYRPKLAIRLHSVRNFFSDSHQFARAQIRSCQWRIPVTLGRLKARFDHELPKLYRVRTWTSAHLRTLSYPIRKVYYFTAYQWTARIKKRDRGGA
jgi:glycosyltransferase involved in cell wall biosynthesis